MQQIKMLHHLEFGKLEPVTSQQEILGEMSPKTSGGMMAGTFLTDVSQHGVSLTSSIIMGDIPTCGLALLGPKIIRAKLAVGQAVHY